LKFGVVKF